MSVTGSGFRVQGLSVMGSGCRVKDLKCNGFRVQGSVDE